MNEIVKVFNDHPVRIVERGGEPWFVAKDVCSYFGDTNHKRSVGRLDDDEREIGPVTDTLGRKQNITWNIKFISATTDFPSNCRITVSPAIMPGCPGRI